MTILPSTPSEGEALRDAALAVLRIHRATLIRQCQRAAVLAALADGEVTADAVRAAVPIPDGINPKLVGAAFRDLATAGVLERVGYVVSRRPAAHARPLSLWHLADANAATRWLANHPPIATEHQPQN